MESKEHNAASKELLGLPCVFPLILDSPVSLIPCAPKGGSRWASWQQDGGRGCSCQQALASIPAPTPPQNEPLGAFSETECGSKTSSIILRREKVKVHLIQLTLHREPEAQELNPLLIVVLVQHIISHTPWHSAVLKGSICRRPTAPLAKHYLPQQMLAGCQVHGQRLCYQQDCPSALASTLPAA